MKSISDSMVERANRYIKWKQNLGYSMSGTAKELLRFARFADEVGHRGPLNTDIILQWAHKAAKDSRLYRSRRVETVRTLARFEATFEPQTEIPRRNIIGPAHQRVQPYIYSDKEIETLMDAAGTLSPSAGLRPRTYQVLIGLLASTGMRTCEALKLKLDDFDSKANILFVNETKFKKSRIIPLADSVNKALSDYTLFKDSYPISISTDCFLVSEQGRALKPSVVYYTFGKIRRATKIEAMPGIRSPRLYDLRHTFACRVVQRWYEEGGDVDQLIPSLSTYLGHVKPNDTYWYLSMVPELMCAVQARFNDSGMMEGGCV